MVIKLKDKRINDIIKTLQDNNGSVFLVGGYVRDYLLGIENKDVDCEVYGLEFNKLKELLGSSSYIYSRFGVLSLNDIEVEFAIPRYENKIGIGHKDFEINLNPHMSIYEAGKRRDFTINAIYYNLQKNILEDPYDGRKDLENKLIKHVSSKFDEDPLRALRALRFSFKLGFKINCNTLELCEKLMDELVYISPSRINQELKKTFYVPNDNFIVGLKYFDILIITKFLSTKKSTLLQERENIQKILINLNNNKEKYTINQYNLLLWGIVFNKLGYDYDNLVLKNKIKQIFISKKEISKILLLLKDSCTIAKKGYNSIDILCHYISEDKIFLDYFNFIELIDKNELSDLKGKVILYEQLLKRYDGRYFIKLGYTGKEIKQMQSKLISDILFPK